MRRLLVLGAGTAGTMVVNKLRPRLDRDEWQITVVDQNDDHHYQPGYLFLPFGEYERRDIVKSRRRFIAEGVEMVTGEIDRVVAGDRRVLLSDGRELSYDYLVIATGTTPRPDKTPGMMDMEWRQSVHEFYTLEGATALAEKLATWEGGRLVVHITEMPIKCPVAPLEFTFLADAYFRDRGMRDRVEIVYVTPLDGAFTKPIASRHLGGMLDERKILLETDFMIERVDNEQKSIVSFDEREIPFDLLVTVPLNMGADYVSRSGAYAGVNGSYFCPASYPSCAGKTNSFDTLLMNKNKVYFNSDNNVYSTVPAVIFLGGSVRFVGQSLEWGRDTGPDGVIANQPLLVSGGTVVFGGDDDPKKGSRGGRSFVANRGSVVFIGVVHNATVAQAALVMKALGMDNALNLDDGGSTALWHGGYKAGPGRNIPNAILFIRK